MSAKEHFYYVEDGILWHEIENDGYTFMKRGGENVRIAMCSVEEAKTKYPVELARAENYDITN
jgi:hypothetical protein